MRKISNLLLIASLIMFSSQAYAQITEFKLTASDATSLDEFGVSVSINGAYAIVGAWQEGDGLHDSDGDNRPFQAGSAYIYIRDGQNWIQQAKLTASDANNGDWFGRSVSISGDYAIVGADAEGDGLDESDGDHRPLSTGSAYIFVRNGQSWAQQAKLTASDADVHDGFGWSVSISGEYAIAGSPFPVDDDGVFDAGSAYIFVRDGQNWTEKVKLTASDAELGDFFGWSVSINGGYAIVGAPSHNKEEGAAYIFVRDGQSWTQQAKLTANDVVLDNRKNFGWSVSISDEYTIVGAKGDNASAGAAYIFVRDDQNWTQQAKLTASDAEANDRFGASVSISGEYAIVGAWLKDEGGVDEDGRPVLPDAGSAYIFVRNGQNWTELAKLTASDAGESDGFGVSVSIDGDGAIVGAKDEGDFIGSGGDDRGWLAGAAYVYNGFTSLGVLSISPASLSFGNVLVGETSTEHVIVKNTGAADLSVTSITISGVNANNFSVDNTPFNLTPGDSTILNVSFTPGVIGSISASLDIESDGGSNSIALVGQGFEPAGLVAYYPFNGNANDESGNGNDGLIMGGVTFEPSIHGQAVRFSSKDTYILLNQSGLSANNWPEITIAAWIKMLEYTTYGTIVQRGDAIPTYSYSLKVGGKLTPNANYNPGTFGVVVADTGFSVIASTFTDTQSLPELNTWYHIVGVYDGISMRYYVNGILDGEEIIPDGLQGSNLLDNENFETRIGGSPTQPTWSDMHINGLIDEVRFYDRALSDQEIVDLYNNIVSIGDEISGVPSSFVLKQNYPNPFNPNTTISYDLPKHSFVTLKIYDLLGKEIKTLVNEEKSPGSYNVNFDASNLSSGTYFYTLRTKDFYSSKKLLLIK